MSTIRPLATIAILAVVGVFLAQKINEGPQSPDGALSEWSDTAPSAEPAAAAPAVEPGLVSGVPPIGGVDATPPVSDALPAPVAVEPAVNDLSGVPPLPPLPPIATTTPAPPVATPAPPTPAAEPLVDLPLPSNIPTANYNAAASPEAAAPLAPVAPPSIEPSAPTAALPPAPDGPAPPAYGSLTPPTAPPLPAAPSTPPPGGYAAAKPAIEAALAANQLSRALLMLSAWRGDATLGPAERQEVDALLGQLAGSVIYSNQHLLEGPYTIKPGETLETVAARYGVSWELLGKINGVADPAAVAPGQTIKVVRGPFRAAVDLSDNELFLTVDGRYAGRFPVTLAGAAAGVGNWRVDQKQAAAGKQFVLSGAGPAPGQQITLDTGAAPPAGQGRIAVADADMNDLFDILSVGSEVTVRR